MLHSTFSKEVTLVSIFRDKAGILIRRNKSSIHNFLQAVGTPHAEVWYEEVWNVSVRLDDDLAQVWCDYAFYIGKNFIHCGVDAFHLHKSKDGWKIFHLSDTRRKTDCNIPKQIEKKRTSP